jgi:hypothetical protein
MGKERLKAKLFRRWLHKNEDTSFTLAPVAERMSNYELMAVIKEFEADGYSLDGRGVPVGCEDNQPSIIIALHEAFERVTGYPLVDLFYRELEERIFETQRKPLLDKFREWLISVSSSKEEWWKIIDWKQIKYEVLDSIEGCLEIYGYPIDENGVPDPISKDDADGLWDTLGDCILKALIKAAKEVSHE